LVTGIPCLIPSYRIHWYITRRSNALSSCSHCCCVNWSVFIQMQNFNINYLLKGQLPENCGKSFSWEKSTERTRMDAIFNLKTELKKKKKINVIGIYFGFLSIQWNHLFYTGLSNLVRLPFKCAIIFFSSKISDL
jgi:hypothetical protein